MFTVGQMLPVVARFAGGSGIDISTKDGRAATLEVYNSINEELMQDGSWDGATADVEFSVCESCFALPSQFATVRALTINDRPAPIRPGGWRYLQQEAALAEGCGLNQVTDMGDHFATARDLSEPMQLMIYSDRPEEGAKAVLQGTDPEGRQIMRGDFPGKLPEPGEEIEITSAGWQPTDGVAAEPMLTIATFNRRPSMVIKTVTVGHVFLMGYKEGQAPEWLATYRPEETNPSYRRYRVNGVPGTSPVTVVARVDLRYLPAVHDDERSLIQFSPAYEIYAKALASRRAGAFDDYQKFRNSALAKLKGQREQKIDSQTHQPNFSPIRGGGALARARR